MLQPAAEISLAGCKVEANEYWDSQPSKPLWAIGLIGSGCLGRVRPSPAAQAGLINVVSDK